VFNLPEYFVFILIPIGRLNILYQRFPCMRRQGHNDVLNACAGFQYPVPVYPSMSYVLHVIKQNKPVNSVDQLKIANVRIKIRLHDGHLHS
jgi:hypothetical protein